jgi:uncharacterized protein
MTGVYLDSSAVVKLAVREPESDALRKYVWRRRPWLSSALARTEVARALKPGGAVAVAAGHEVIARCDLVRITDAILNHAGALSPIELPSLDAIHIATELRLGGDAGVLVTYDGRMAGAARELGVRVASPS